MQNRAFVFLIYFCTGISAGFAQKIQQASHDTVYIYETITVYDTVIIHDTIRVREIEKLEPHHSLNEITSEASHSTLTDPFILLISGSRAATFSGESIIPENLKNSSSMKTLSFFGLVFLAFQHMVVAQSDIGISAGTGSWWANCNQPVSSRSVSSGSTVGIFMNSPVGNDFFIHSALNYTFLRSNYSYKANLDTLTNYIVGEGESASNYHQISIPMELGYTLGKVSLLTGMEYAYRFSDSWLHKKMNLLNYTAGIKYAVTDKMAVNLSYYQGLTNDYHYSGSISDPISGLILRNYDDYWKSSRLMLTLSCNLWQKSKKSPDLPAANP